MYVVVHVKYLLLWYFNANWNFSQVFWRILKNKFHEIGQLGAELFHADGRMDWWTDMLKLIVAFHNFANVRSDENLV
jgi:hypothetical protein